MKEKSTLIEELGLSIDSYDYLERKGIDTISMLFLSDLYRT
ncbi:hypothetical protein SAMN02745158_02687 [Lactonifactor longoviformis DSM 17459]|uniref:Uncharacterized protein n=1 Tax=Lactonifactor longoviformis DSM 17459 TaxID=1122155 RepID=A0A1M4Z9V9_9CLOT|nr:hypothetical protein SAMN02745158_02687 [Lactonifactor longoviformis DSM 17459]